MNAFAPLALLSGTLAWVGCNPWTFPKAATLVPQATAGSGTGGTSIGTTGGNGTSSSTSSGSTGSLSCANLGETACLSRPDCQPVFGADSTGTTVFEQCTALTEICSPPACGEGCRLVSWDGGCGATCECERTSCSGNADCPSGDYCDFGSDGGAWVQTPLGQCLPVQVCPAVVCASGDPLQVCTTGTDSNGCPSCSCTPLPGCTNDSECASGMVCLFEPCASIDCIGRCVAACQSTGDCPAGQICVDPCQCNGPGPCGDCPAGGGTCQMAPVVACTSDAACAPGQTCQPAPTPTCPPGDPCPAPDPAELCAPAPTCETDTDCGSGELCGPNPLTHCTGPEEGCAIELVCQPGGVACGGSNCGAGEVCEQIDSPIPCPDGGGGFDGCGLGAGFACIAYPASCEGLGCDCVFADLCGSSNAGSSDCTGGIPMLTCIYLP